MRESLARSQRLDASILDEGEYNGLSVDLGHTIPNPDPDLGTLALILGESVLDLEEGCEESEAENENEDQDQDADDEECEQFESDLNASAPGAAACMSTSQVLKLDNFNGFDSVEVGDEDDGEARPVSPSPISSPCPIGRASDVLSGTGDDGGGVRGGKPDARIESELEHGQGPESFSISPELAAMMGDLLDKDDAGLSHGHDGLDGTGPYSWKPLVNPSEPRARKAACFFFNPTLEQVPEDKSLAYPDEQNGGKTVDLTDGLADAGVDEAFHVNLNWGQDDGSDDGHEGGEEGGEGEGGHDDQLMATQRSLDFGDDTSGMEGADGLDMSRTRAIDSTLLLNDGVVGDADEASPKSGGVGEDGPFGPIPTDTYGLWMQKQAHCDENNPDAHLFAAVHQRDLDALDAGLKGEGGVDVDGPRDDYGNTLLLAAAHAGSKRVVRWCVQNGASLDSVNRYGNTALHILVEFRQRKLVRYLKRKGASTEAKNEAGLSCFQRLADCGERGDGELGSS